jgi:uncharacterized protein
MPDEVVVADTSPLQYLHQLGHLGLLPLFYTRMLVPSRVADELARGEALGIDVPRPRQLAWCVIADPQGHALLEALTVLDPGERDALALALERHAARLLIDDAEGRRIATRLGVPVVGTLGILLRAKRDGHVPAINPLLDQLHHWRYRLDPRTRQEVLRLAGET